METPKSKLRSSELSVSSHVRVLLRVRPFVPQEMEDGSNPIPCVTVLDQEGGEVTVQIKDQMTIRNECFKLDSFFGQDDPINQIFHKEIYPAIPGIFDGISATVFAYGATGSGKTYTMQGSENDPGLIPLAMSAILTLSEGLKFSVDISYYEVYMDRCYDLLGLNTKEVMVLDDKYGKVQLKGLSMLPVSSMDEFFEIYSTGLKRRKVSQTALNDLSSRSHVVLAISVRNCEVMGKLNLIDLAGNEDNRRTCNEGARLKESASISRSLFALSNVIYALNHNEQRIPFRESKLTRILQDSLGGESHAFMIACLNPGSYQEAINTVSLAARSRHIVNYFVESAAKREGSCQTVDMEAKLKVWLESKGKSKGTRKTMSGLFSPSIFKTPISLKNYSNGERASRVLTKERIAESFSLSCKGRKLFNSHVKTPNKNEENEACIGRKMNDSTNSSDEISKTPKTPCSLASQKTDLENSAFLEKFKGSIVEEYISILNEASKEELLLLKGIGPKTAECILELREEASMPIQSVEDLEKMGLSKKQVWDLIRKGAEGLFY